MNSREQYLQKQNERLSNQITVTLTAFQNLLDENEYLASVACGFAWDLMIEHMADSEDSAWRTLDSWEFAIAAAEKQNAGQPK